MATLNIKEFLDQDEKKDLLRLLTAGSVDDGKSTLIGRLLFDSKKLYEDQLQALERDSKRVGNAGDHIDYALLLDGLKAEREEGITIDVAYRYFSTNQRKFIIADTPGHEQFLFLCWESNISRWPSTRWTWWISTKTCSMPL